MFDYLKKENKDEINEIIKALAKLKVNMRNYNIQPLQSMNLLKTEKNKENKKILESVDNLLHGEITVTGVIEKIEAKYSKDQNEATNIIKKNVSQNVEVKLDNIENTVFSIADLSFTANKYTKWLCESLIQKLENNEDGFIDLVNDLKKEVYFKVNNEKNTQDKKIFVNNKLEEISNKLYTDTNYCKNWKDNIEDKYKNALNIEKNIKMIVKGLYSELEQIWDIESVLYEIKTQLNKQLVKCLIKDNYETFRNWGFSKDENDKWVLNFEPENVFERYSFHVPNLSQILHGKLITRCKQ